MSVLLSILICSVPERLLKLQELLNQLNSQTKDKPVEILCIMDNRYMTIGKKRQKLNELSQGKYIIHVDDDDRVSNDFVDALLEKIRNDDYDCINFTCMVSLDKKPPIPCYYSKDFSYQNFPHHFLRKPNSRCCYKREIALRHPFQDVPFAEDDEWGERASKDIKNEILIPKILYYYDFISKPNSWYTHKGSL